MDKESIAGAIIVAICCFGCGIIFSGIGIWANRANKPVHFWAGINVASEKVSDIPAYNHENAVMWTIYAIPYWLAGVFGCLGLFGEGFTIAAVIMLFAACFPGIFILVAHYRRIEKRYIHP